MIFDLLTLKDPYKRMKIYPSPSGVVPFGEGGLGTVQYAIDEGWYMGCNEDWYGERRMCTVDFSKIFEKNDPPVFVNVVKFAYRSNNSFHVRFTWDRPDAEYLHEFVATDTFKTVSFVFDNYVEYSTERKWSFVMDWHEDSWTRKGDFIIIKNLEFLTT